MEKDKQHLVNIEKVEYNYHNHIDTAEILSLLHTVKLQNNKIITLLLSTDDDAATQLEKQMDAWLVKLNKSVDVIEKVSDRVK